MEAPTRGLRGPTLLFCAALALAALVRVHRLGLPLERDEGEYAYGATLILDGAFSYDALRTMKLPGVHLLAAPFLALLGRTPEALRAALLVVDVVAALAFLALARRFLAPWTAAVAASAFVLLQLSLTFLGLFAHAENFALSAALVGLALAARAAEGRRPRAWLASGLAFGVAFLMKQPAMAFAALGLVGLLFWRRGTGERQLAARAGAWLAGCALPYALVCAWMAAIGGFGAFWFATMTYASAYASDTSLGQGAALLGDELAAWWHFQPGFCLLVALGAVAFAARVELRRAAPLFVGALLAGAASASAGLYFRTHYFVFLLPALALAAGAGADTIAAWIPRAPRAAVASLVLAAAAGLGAWREREYLLTGDPDTVATRLYHPNPTGELAPLVEWLRANTRAPDRVAVLGSEPEIPFLAGRRSATGYVYMYPLFELHPYARAMHERAIAEIEAADPPVVVLVNVSTSWLARTGSENGILEWWGRVARERWRLECVLDLSEPFHPVWLTGDAARAHRPTGRSWVSVFTRRP